MIIQSDSTIKYRGITDLPIQSRDEDNLKVLMYIEGLTEFIRSCATPMTLALQGDWGVGKTSFMNLVIDQLENENESVDSTDRVETIVFNTWKYAQFNQEQNLSLSFLSYIVSQLYDKSIPEILSYTSEKISGEKKDGNFVSAAKVFGRLLSGMATTAASQALSSLVTGTVPSIENAEIAINRNEAPTNKPNHYQQMAYMDSALAIEELKAEFIKAVNYKLQKNNCDRIVIFIDDLDRLDPVVAVNLLEIIKIFLDVPKCVFVLAIDYAVVTKGIKLKNRDYDMDDEKAQNFFDKMIQVPFRIPMEFYNFNEFLTTNLPEIKESENLHAIIRHSMGHNPRGVKRLLNSYYLISNIIFRGAGEASHEQQRGYLIALLCMQLSHEPLYRYFCLRTKSLEMLSAHTEERIAELLNESNIAYKQSNLRKYVLFLHALYQYLFENQENNGIYTDNLDTEGTLKLFWQTLSYANITSESASNDVEETVEVALKDILDYTSTDYSVVTMNCERFGLKSKTTNGLVFEMYEKVIPSNEMYIQKLTDYKQLPNMKASGIEKRLILPFLEQLSKDEEAAKWIKENVSDDYSFTKGEYVSTLSKRKLPGTNYEIITNYPAVTAIQNMYHILKYLGDDIINETKVILKKKKK